MEKLKNKIIDYMLQGIILGGILIFVLAFMLAFHGCSSSVYNCNSKKTYDYKKKLAPSMVYHK